MVDSWLGNQEGVGFGYRGLIRKPRFGSQHTGFRNHDRAIQETRKPSHHEFRNYTPWIPKLGIHYIKQKLYFDEGLLE